MSIETMAPGHEPERIHAGGPDLPPYPPEDSRRAAARALDEAPYWPVTRLAAWSLTAALALSILLPVAVGHRVGMDWIVLLLPAIVATLSSRALFETFGLSVLSRRLADHLLAAVLPALLAVAIMAVACAVVGDSWTPLVGVTSAALVILTLVVAGASRDVEIRLRLSLRRVFFVGAPDSQRDLERELSRRSDAQLVGSMVINRHPRRESLMEAVLESHATVLVLDLEAMRLPDLVDAASRLNLAGLRIRDLVSYYEMEFKKIPLSEISPTWFLFDIASIHHQRPYRFLRRGIDVLLAVTLLALALPGLIVLGLGIRLTSSGPAVYRQRRVGKGGAEFVLLKLRTMRGGSGPAAWATSETHRITPIGRFLRRFRIDELPQLWNVIRGDLALIGPRPEQVAIAAQLEQELTYYSSRHCIRPGITGWAQVNLGYSGSMEGTVAKLQRDLYYVKHNGLRLDALIVWLTIRAILVGPEMSRPPRSRGTEPASDRS